MNDPLGLFEEENNNDPLGLFSEQEAERSLGEKSLGILETGAGMLAGAPAQIAGGLAGVGSLMIGEGVDKAMERMNAVQRSNFGFGAYEPSTEAGKEYTQNLGEFLQGIQEGGGDIGAKLGGMVGRENAGRYVGELLTGTAMEFPELLLGGAALSMQRPRPAKPSATSKVQDIINQDRGLEVTVRTPDGGLDETVQFPPTNETTQLELFDQPLQGRMVSPYEATTGDWRIDENGMPVRIDLSLEAQNMQNPLQRNLWGDELDVQFPRDPAAPLGPRSTGDIEGFERFSEPVNFRNDPENQRPLTEAIDSMDPAARTAALEQTQMGREMEASGQLEAARMEAETMSWLEQAKRPETKKPRPVSKGRGRSQRGAVWFGDLGETKKLQDLVDGMEYRFPALEKLPNKEEFTWEQLQQSINRQEVPEPERKLLTQAYDVVASLPENRDPNNPWKGTKANAKEFVDQLAALASDYSLKGKRSISYADYGLANIGRSRPSEGSVGVKPSTTIWESPYELSEGVRNHFTTPNYFGHTRNFIEDGQRYVVEIQSDLVQKYKKARSEALAPYDNSELSRLYDRTQVFLEGLDAINFTNPADRNFGKLRETLDMDQGYSDHFNTKMAEVGFTDREAAIDALSINHPDAWAALDKMARNLENTLAKINREQTLRNNSKTIDTMGKNWFVRLVREELADAAKKGESTVRFASADTMAKVEGWPDIVEDIQNNIRDLEQNRASIERAIERDPTNVFADDWRNELQMAEERLVLEKRELEARLATGQKFDESVQGIYDRYNKDITKYLTSIGGKPVVDATGNTWIEVPVEKSRQRPIMFGQRGVLKIDWSDILKVDNAPLDGKLIPPTPDVAAAIEAAKKQGKDGKQWNYLQSGATSVAMKTGSPIIRAAEDIVQNAIKRADLAIRNYVFPAEKALRTLPKQELVDLGELMKVEMFEGKAINPDVLARNLSEKQLRTYTQMRELFDQTLAAQNAARIAKGQKPINAREAYMASRWQGDFRQPVYDSEGNLVWYLAAHTRKGLETQAKALQKIKPDLVIDPAKAHVTKSLKSGADLQSAYSTMLDILDPNRDKAAIQALKSAVEDQMLEEGEMTLAQSKHFKSKSGVRGFAGDRPWMDKAKDITEMFQQQIQYAKNAFKWSEMQGVADSLKSIITDEELQKTQPNNIKFIREYTKNALGYSEADVVRALDDAMRNAGVSPQMVSNAVGHVKSFFITQKLAISSGYTMSNLIQAANVIPYLADMAGRKIIGNPLTTLPVGFLGGMAMGVSHYLKSLGSSYLDQLPNQFFKDAFQYAEQNGVTARSVYDEAPIESGMGIGSAIGRGMSKTMTIPETFVRSVAFMTYAEWMRSSGKFKNQMEIFQEAERLVNKSMVDYRETERPMMFSKLGTTGNFLNTLQTYPISFYNQWSYMLGQAAKGNPAGLVTLAAFQFAIAGAMGMPFFDDMEKMYKWIRDNMVGDSTWTKMMSNPFFSDPKSWMIDNLGESAVYGYLSDKTGIGLTSRVAAPGAGAMLQSPIGPITDIAGQVGAVGKAIMDPTDKTKLAQAAMKVAPVGLQGALETAPFMKDITYVTRPDGTRVYQRASDLMDRRGGYARTPEEDEIRQLGIRSQKEVLARDVEYAARSNAQQIRERGGEIVDKYYNAIRTKDYKKAKELNDLYVTLTGKAISDTQLNNQLMDEFLTGVQKTSRKATTPLDIQQAVRMNKILKENQ